MPCYFPNSDVLHLALTSGAVPADISLAPVAAAFDATGGIYAEPAAALPPAVQSKLRRLGAILDAPGNAEPLTPYLCWPQLLPLHGGEPAAAITAQSVVLFELTRAEWLSEWVGEMLRLGNDRQACRWFSAERGSGVLLRVIGPPYYTLLRAIDSAALPDSPRAYVERAPRIWVEVGYSHPMIQQLHAPQRQLLFLRPPRIWWTLDDAPFQDIYEILDFRIPHQPVRWQAQAAISRLQVPVQLAPSTTAEPAELWVLHDQGFEQLDELVRHSDDQLVARLAFAVAQQDGKTTYVLRVRPSRQEPPVLVLLAQSFRSLLRLPNLFVPVGKRLQPPLRRDAVRALLAADPDQITWLYPHPDSGFTPEFIADAAFRPLSDWVDYVLHHDRAALQSWIEATTFDFEPFVCQDDEPAPARKKPKAEKRGQPPPPQTASTAPVAALALPIKKGHKPPTPRPPASHRAALDKLVPSDLEKQLYAVEQRFLALHGPVDDPQRLALWPELASLNAALGRSADAALCWMHALWPSPAQAPAMADAWASSDAIQAEGVAELLGQPAPTAATVRAVAAWLASRQQVPAPLLASAQRFLTTHEELLPVRAVWLAAFAAYRLNRDVLALTRTRDHLLERLFHSGLTHDQDVPSFLRFSGARRGERLRAFRDWLLNLPERVCRWITQHASVVDIEPRDTVAYARLILAFGLARLGEDHAARQLAASSKEWLEQREVEQKDVHHVLLEAFGCRIHQALQGKAVGQPLPSEWLEYAEKTMDQHSRFKVDRMRMLSRILEPHEEVNAFRSFHARVDDPFHRSLVLLPDIIDRHQLESECRRLHGEALKVPYRRFRVVETALKLSPRIGETFAHEMLEEVATVCAGHDDLIDRARLLEHALFVAAHFGKVEFVPALLERFHRLLRDESAAVGLDRLESLAGQCFRGLRKLGMQDEIRTLLADLTAVVTRGKSFTGLRLDGKWPAMARTLLHVAAGWFYVGNDEEGRRLLEEARLLLFEGNLEKLEQTQLACTYVATLGQAPVELALGAIDELLDKMERVFDTHTTNSHFSLAKLRVVEGIVLTVVTEEFAMGQIGKRWLEDDEFVVRRRIHRDLQRALDA